DTAMANNYGVYVFSAASSNRIGTDSNGTADSDERNVISGNTANGVYISDAGTSTNEVTGNYIGVAADGTTDIGNGLHGIRIDDTATSNFIGGTGVADANTIAYNGDAAGEDGISIEDANTDYNSITRNSIFSNQTLGIDLVSGANESIAAPAITGSANGGAAATITLSGTSPVDASGVTIELFESDGGGEGKTSITDTTTTDGSWSTNITGSYTEIGKKIVATATNSTSSTSEFSAEYTIPDINAVADTTGSDTSVDEGNTANLVGSSSYDPNSGQSITSWLWEWIAGEAVIVIDSTSETASFEAPQVAGESSTTIRLTVNGGDTDQVIVTINNLRDKLNLTISDNIMDLDLIMTSAVNTDQHTITVSSTAVNGYTCSVVEDGNLRDGANNIDDVSDSTVNAGSEEYGITTTGGGGVFADDQAISGAPLNVAHNDGVVTESVTTITYKGAVNNTTPTGYYNHIVTYTCVADF
ncbi:hypothetical protein LCGC14_2476360, partial [marine sediment metagenome]